MTSSAPIELGPFELHKVIGRGGMAEVWLGRHVAGDVPVAIKLVTAAGGKTEPFREALHREVEAVARLRHPNIVMVLDHGRIDSGCAAASGGRIVEGTPFLAMEYLSGGTLQVPRDTHWGWLRSVLVALLDALSHAHARGVVHRDLKPANVLLSGPEDEHPGLRLTDFGIAHAADASQPSRYDNVICGSPSYMAPEQFRRDWRSYGPWTDLYALGCLSHLLACGQPPFPVRTLREAAHKHLAVPPPSVPEQPWLPSGFGGWVLQLLSKAPEGRFGSAADARAALLGLDGASESSSGLRTTIQQDLSTVTDFAPTLAWDAGAPNASVSSSTPRPVKVQLVPQLPRRWKAGGAGLSPRLQGAGLGLYGLRTIPFVGREGVRDKLWSALKGAYSSQGVSAVLLRGQAGVGKSRIARWLGERAAELAGVESMRATHGPIPSAHDGIGQMVARYLRLVGLDKRDSLARIQSHLATLGKEDDGLSYALNELVSPSSGDDTFFTKPQERFTAVARWLAAVSHQRPIIFWLDDVQWGRESLAFARWLLVHGNRLGVRSLLLMTLREEALKASHTAHAHLEAICADPHCSSLEVPPLSSAERRVLVSELLGLSPALSKEVDQRSGGIPLFAVQLVGDWVARDMLLPSTEGFVIRPGCSPEVPDAIHGLWSGRIERFAATQDEGTAEVLGVASALGNQVRNDEWRDACEIAGLEIPPRLVQALVRARLAEREGQSWAFSHGMLRESLERQARERDDWPRWNAACAEMLLEPLRLERSENLERRAWHLEQAGQDGLAFPVFVEAARRRSISGEYAPAQDLLIAGRDAGLRSGTDQADPVWGELWVLCARVSNLMGRLDEALNYSDEVVRLSRIHGWTDILVAGLLRRAQAALQRDQLDLVEASLEEAERQATLAQDPGQLGSVFRQQSRLAGLRGDADLALSLGQRAVELLARSSRRGSQAEATRRLAYEYSRRGDQERALRLARQACAIGKGGGAKLIMYNALITLGEVHRLSAAHGEAAKAYHEAAHLARTTGCILPYIALGNLALLHLQAGRWEDAEQVLTECFALVETARGGFSKMQESVFHLALLPCLAERGAWQSWHVHLGKAEEMLASTGGRLETDVGFTTRVAGERAHQAGKVNEARRVWALGRKHLSAGAPSEELNRLSALLARSS